MKCQCAQYEVTCASRMTQEDLLCDICRTKECGVMYCADEPCAGHIRCIGFKMLISGEVYEL